MTFVLGETSAKAEMIMLKFALFILLLILSCRNSKADEEKMLEDTIVVAVKNSYVSKSKVKIFLNCYI